MPNGTSLSKCAYCLTHDKLCRLPSGHYPGSTLTVEAAGASCTPFSVAGKRKKARLDGIRFRLAKAVTTWQEGDAAFQSHMVWYDMRLRNQEDRF